MCSGDIVFFDEGDNEQDFNDAVNFSNPDNFDASDFTDKGNVEDEDKEGKADDFGDVFNGDELNFSDLINPSNCFGFDKGADETDDFCDGLNNCFFRGERFGIFDGEIGEGKADDFCDFFNRGGGIGGSDDLVCFE